ncbi:unnamed protein product [Orchesella dallaii]|uniref:Phospholipid/glycerol acyltransferase domain-containing protein n=1 Tax=Orchesella dallaii TaxID=48710 RepID=A0ABP1PYW0_9HEXA
MVDETSGKVIPINPLYHRVEPVPSWRILLVPILWVLACVKIISMGLVGCVGLILVWVGGYELTEETFTKPLPKWKRILRWVIAKVVMRLFVIAAGFKWKIKGKRASPKEAPIFVVGPHSSYFDVFVVILLGAPSVLAKASTNNVILFGRLVKMTQGMFVSRKSKDSKRQIKDQIIQRAESILNGSGMPQMYIYAEGTTGNRSSLLQFKLGAFYPGVPVQPVLIRYPNAIDAVTYTFDGHSLSKIIWYALSSQFYVNIEIEYLPVYVPNEEEKNDPILFSENVRKVMSESLDIPTSEYSLEEGNLLVKLREKILYKLCRIRLGKRNASCDGFYAPEIEMFLQCTEFREDFDWMRNFERFLKEFFYIELGVDEEVPGMPFVFNCFKMDEGESCVDIRPYLVLAILSSDDLALGTEGIVESIYNMYCITGDNNADNIKEISEVIKRIFELDEDKLPVDPGVNNQALGAGDGDAGNIGNIEKDALALRHKLTLCVEFTKLLADAVNERLPKDYPPREYRDKPIRQKDKLD